MIAARFLRPAVLALILLLPAVAAPAAPPRVVTSQKGVTAWLVEDHTNPLISVSLLFRGGTADDPAPLAGLSDLVSGLLDEGAGDLDSRAFQDRLDVLNVRLGFSASADLFSGRMQTLSARRREAFSLLGQALSVPRFDPEPVARMREVFKAELRRRQESPEARAADALFAAMFPDHPYGRPGGGSPETLDAITADDLHAFARLRLTRDRLLVGVVGDVTAKELGPLLDSAFAALPATSEAPRPEPVRPRLDGKVHRIEMPVPQAAAVFAQAGPARTDPDWHPFQVMMYILGDGGFASRLTAEVREKRGLAYGVQASSAPFVHAPLVLGSVGTRNEKIGESLALIRAEWEKMRKHGPTAGEVDKALAHMIGALPLRLNSGPTIARTLTAMQVFGLPPDDLDRRPKVLSAITRDRVAQVAAKWLDSRTLTFAVAGRTAGGKAR